MRVFKVLLIVLIIVAGLAFGAINADPATLSLLITEATLPVGSWVLAALLLGVFCGGLLVYLMAVVPKLREIKRLRRNAAAHAVNAGANLLTHE